MNTNKNKSSFNKKIYFSNLIQDKFSLNKPPKIYTIIEKFKTKLSAENYKSLCFGLFEYKNEILEILSQSENIIICDDDY